MRESSKIFFLGALKKRKSYWWSSYDKHQSCFNKSWLLTSVRSWISPFFSFSFFSCISENFNVLKIKIQIWLLRLSSKWVSNPLWKEIKIIMTGFFPFLFIENGKRRYLKTFTAYFQTDFNTWNTNMFSYAAVGRVRIQ